MSLRRFFSRGWWDGERARELESYVAIETDDNLARGMAPAPFADKWLGIIFFKEDGAAVLAERLEMLRRAGQGPFGRPSDD